MQWNFLMKSNADEYTFLCMQQIEKDKYHERITTAMILKCKDRTYLASFVLVNVINQQSWQRS